MLHLRASRLSTIAIHVCSTGANQSSVLITHWSALNTLGNGDGRHGMTCLVFYIEPAGMVPASRMSPRLEMDELLLLLLPLSRASLSLVSFFNCTL